MTPVIAVIPARFQSTRFPGKPLADQTGKPLIAHVVEQVQQAGCLDEVIVATDDARIANAVKEHCRARAVLTRAEHENGTSRIAEVAASFAPGTVIVNVQGDEPEIEPGHIELAVRTLAEHENADVATLARRFGPGEDPDDANLVKVVLNTAGEALYFSRSLIPYRRDATAAGPAPLCHVGLYAYRREFVIEFAAMKPTPLERSESLEQLRMLENGRTIGVAVLEAGEHQPGIDTPAQYAAFVERWRGRVSRC